MKHFTCGSVVPGCTATFSAETTLGIFEQVTAHALQDHGLSDLPDELTERVLANITE
jgi:predicted small metal-binding protein